MNDDNDIIEFIAEKLQPYPEITYDDSVKNQISILKNYEDGFDIVLYTDESESILYLDGFHHHFAHTDHDINEMFQLFFYALVGKVKLEILLKDGKPYKFNLQAQDDDGDWYIYQTMGKIFYKFWHKTSTKYLQNQFSIELL